MQIRYRNELYLRYLSILYLRYSTTLSKGCMKLARAAFT